MKGLIFCSLLLICSSAIASDKYKPDQVRPDQTKPDQVMPDQVKCKHYVLRERRSIRRGIWRSRRLTIVRTCYRGTCR